MRDRPGPPWLPRGVLVALVAVGAAACGGPGAPDGSVGNDLVEVTEALCTAADEPDLAEAIAGFQRVHGPLHDLADQVSQTDRQVAARLLVAKQQVEADIDEDPGASLLRPHLADLSDAAAAALRSLDLPVPATCPTPETSP